MTCLNAIRASGPPKQAEQELFCPIRNWKPVITESGIAIGRVLAEVTPVPEGAPEPDYVRFLDQPPTRVHVYRDEQGRQLRQVARVDLVDGKIIRPLTYVKFAAGDMGWTMGAPEGPRTLYGLDKLAERPGASVLVVEGEKTADAAANAAPEFVTLTWQGGAGAAELTDWRPLAGREVTLWPDNDQAGRKAMEAVAEKLRQTGAKVIRIVDLPPSLPPKWDIADAPPDGFDVMAALTGAPAAQAATGNTTGSKSLRQFVICAVEFMKLDLPPRRMIVDPFLTTSSLAMVYASRGLGKTWFVLTLAIDLARGENFLAYKVERPWNVLLIDGEMALGQLQERIRALAPEPPANFMLLASETLHREGCPINLHNPEDQAAVEEMIEQLGAEGRRPDVVIIDNLSSLSGGKDENDNTAMDSLLQWLVKLRHTGVAVVLVHHAGKNGDQRGASRREDLLDTSIALKPPGEDATPHQGAHMVLTFAKTRGLPPAPDVLELRLVLDRDRLRWQFGAPVKSDRATEMLRMIWEKKPVTQAELAQVAGVKDAAVSLQMKKLKIDGYAESNPLRVTDLGMLRLMEVWPELEAVMQQQSELPLRSDGII